MQEDEPTALERVGFGDLLRHIRMTHTPTLTQERLADLMGVSRALVNFMEQERRPPTRDFVSRAVEALDLPESDVSRLWEAAGFVPPKAPLPFNARATRADVEQALPSSHQNPILAYLAHADVFPLIEGWRTLAEADNAIRDGRYDHASMLCVELVECRFVTPSLRLFARRKLAEANRQLGRLETAAQVISTDAVAADLPDPDTDPSPMTAFLFALIMAERGEVALRRGQYQDGLKYFEASKKGYAILLGNSPGESNMVIHLGLGMAFARMAKASLFLGDEHQAEEDITAAELHLNTAAPSPQRDRFLRKLVELRAWALARQGDFENAIKYHEEARDAARAAGDKWGVLNNCVYLGDDWRRRAEKAIEDVSRDALRQRAPREAYAAAQKTTHYEIDEWVRCARRAYEDAMRLMESHAAPYMKGLCERNLGIIARFQNQFAEADVHLHRAEHFDNDSGMKLKGRLPAIYEARGDLYWWQGMHESAVRSYAQALEAFEELRSTSNASSPDRKGDTRAHARERLRVYDSLKALLPLPAAQQELDRWRPDMSAMLDNQWQNTTAILKQQIIGAIQQQRGERVTTSDCDLKWISELAGFEEIAGPRILAQNSLSAGWSDDLLTRFSVEPHTDAEHAAANDAFRRRRTIINEFAGAGYRDLAAKDIVLSDLAMPDELQSARNVLAFMEQSQGAYALTLSRLPLPLAFTVKGDRVLAEVPAALLDGIQPAATPSQDSLHLTQTTDKETNWCYRFDDADLAYNLTTIFKRLEEIAAKQSDDDAATILRRLLSAKVGRATRTGM